MCAVEIRPANLEDAQPIAQAHIKSWKAAYKGIIDQSYLDNGLNVAERTQRWRENLAEEGWKTTFVAVAGSCVAGFATVGPSRNEACPDYAELYAIYLDPDWFGKGVGAQLFNRAVQHARAQGFDKMFVNFLSENHQALAFYERLGAAQKPDAKKTVTIDGKSYPEAVYEWLDLTVI